MKKAKTTSKQPRKLMTFREALQNPETKKLIEALEWGSSDPAVNEQLKAEFKEKTGGLEWVD